MRLLGLRLCDHDSNITLYDNGNLSYYKLERDTQIKHDSFDNLWEWEFVVKDKFGLDLEDIDEIAIVLDPWRHGMGNSLPEFPAQEIEIFKKIKCKVWWLNHHFAHALSHNLISETKPDIHVVIDGYGDHDIAWTVFKDEKILDYGLESAYGSFGNSYANLARHLNLTGHRLDLAGKTMGIQAFGQVDENYYHSYKDKNLIESLDPRFWVEYNHCDLFISENRKLDWVKTCHELMQNKLIQLFQKYVQPNDKIGYSGGAALNVCWNTELKKIYKNLEIFPHCMDDGLSIGCIEWLRLKNNLEPTNCSNFPFIQMDESPKNEPTDATIDFVAELLAQGKIVGWYQGHGEVGYRALGNRSILMNPMVENGKNHINQKVKNRENYRPFGATILKEHSKKYFKNGFDNPYMLYSDEFLSSFNDFKSIKHIDNTCRTQTLGVENTVYRKLLEKFYDKTGVPMLLNTSLNRGGKPICGSIRDAFGVYYETELDCLVIGNEVYIK